MSGKWIAFGIWTLLIVAGLTLMGISVTKDEIYDGTNIELNTGRDLQIDAETVIFEAASSNFFVLRKESGETIVGVPTQPPLGWSSNKYFIAGPQEIPGGEWLFQDGNATVKITSEKAVTVRVTDRDPNISWVLLSLLAFVIWILGIVLVVYG